MDFAIRTEHLTKVYAGRVIAVNDLTLEIPRGAVYGLLGPNGAGKTTTLRLLLGLQRPTAGSAEVLGHRCCVSMPPLSAARLDTCPRIRCFPVICARLSILICWGD